MTKISLFLLCLISLSLVAQERKYSTFYEQRSSLFNSLPISSDDIVFLGNSITNGGEWSELFNDIHIKNRGISGDVTQGVLDRLDNIVKKNPKKIFLLIGINDIARNIPVDSIAETIEHIVVHIQQQTPHTGIYLQSILPVNPDSEMFQGHMKPDLMKILNNKMLDIADAYGCKYVDLYSHFVEDDSEKLNSKYTNDGLHLLGEAYLLWRDIVMPYVKE